MIKIIIFLLISIGIAKFYWPSFLKIQSRDFYRFFALEFLLILVLVTGTFWFYHPFSFFQLISWALFASAIFTGYRGFTELRNLGKPTDKIVIESTTILVTSGIYKYIRHPLYGALIFIGTGCFFKNPSLLATSLFFVSTVFFYATALTEERESILKFGEEYDVYMDRTRMFVPYIF